MNYVTLEIRLSKIEWSFYEDNEMTASGKLPIDNDLPFPAKLNWVHLEVKDLLLHIKPDKVYIKDIEPNKDEVLFSSLSQLSGVVINSSFEVVQYKMKII